MVTGLLPVVGVPLPLVSYGGSSMLAVMGGFGLLMNCYIHMATTAIPKDKVLQDIKGVIHVDKTSRVQICEENSLLGKILMNLNKYKIYVIANTSFNISSDPMVYDKEDAFLAVERMKIKYLLTETGLYKRK